MAWFIGQSTLVIVLAFGLGLVVGWLLWARRIRRLMVEIVAARIRAAEQAGSRSPYGRRITWTSSGHALREADSPDAVCRRDVNAVHGGPHIPAPRIEPADIADQDALDADGFGDDRFDAGRFEDDGFDDGGFDDGGFDDDNDLDDQFDSQLDDASDAAAFDPRSDPRFRHRLGQQRSTSDLRGLDRFRDLFTPSNGRTPRTPEPRRTEPELATSQDVDSGPSHPRPTAADSADDTTLAAAGLAGDSTADIGDSTADITAGTSSEPGNTSERDGPADDLTRIDGIGPKAAAALVAAGIRTFDQLAAAGGDTVATALRASGVRLTASVHAWPLAAHRLAVRRIADRADDPGSASGAVHTAGRSTDGRSANGQDVNGLGEINGHEAGRLGGPANDRRGGLLPKRRSPGTPARRSIPPDALDPDDLARIEGIGPKFAAALVASGIRTFGQLADANEMALRKAIGTARPTAAPSLPTWPTQARLLAIGDEDGFAALTARLIAGRGLDDNLERIDGIGPQTAAALRAAGIHTYRALAASDGNHVRAALENAGMRCTPRIATWAARAKLLADGDEEGFADLAGPLDTGPGDTGRLGDGPDEEPA